MRATLRKGLKKKFTFGKQRRKNRFGRVQIASSSDIKVEDMVAARSGWHNIRHLTGKRGPLTVVSAINKDIYKFEKKSLLTEFKAHRSFREALMSGAYFYHKGRICLYHPDVFVGSKNGIKIADFVNENPEDYLLSHYTRRISDNGRTLKRSSPYVLTKKAKLRKEGNVCNKSFCDVKINHAKKYSTKDYGEGNKYSEAVLCVMDLVQGFVSDGQENGSNDTFGVFFTNLMAKRNISVRQLADKTDIPERTIIRMRSEEEYKPSIEYLLACCIVMKLPPWDSDKLFELAGIVLRPNNKKERCYIALLHVFFKEGSISVCDEVLAFMGMQTLSSIISAKKKNK